MSEERKVPTQSIQVTLSQNTYIVKFPTVGQLLDIEAFKMVYSKDQYNKWMQAIWDNTATESQLLALEMSNMFAHLTVLIPELSKDLRVKSLRDLSQSDLKPFMETYQKQIRPWLDEWQVYIAELDKANESKS